MQTDVRETTLPPGIARQAFDGETWIAICDRQVMETHHTCMGGGWPWDRNLSHYGTFATEGWQPCDRADNCAATISRRYWAEQDHDSLEEANAAFDDLERKLIAGELR